MSTDRVAMVEQNLDRYLATTDVASALLHPGEPLRPGSTLSVERALALFEAQLLSRALDVAARELKKTTRSYYTIGSAGHEQNAVLGELVRATDPCVLHYRSGAFMMAQGRKDPGWDPVEATVLGLRAAAGDPVCEGRHKVWGSRRLWIPPQTSTIASQVPKGVGLAFALGRARRIGHPTPLPPDAIVLCSMGDASVNHASALAGINAARYAARRGNPTSVLFVCEDNQRGISVDTPRRWIRDFFGGLAHLRYFEAEGDLDRIWEVAERAISTCRHHRVPVFLRLCTVRLWGHAGSDVETTYRTLEQIEQIEAQDPLLANARLLVETGAATPAQLQGLRRSAQQRVASAIERTHGARSLPDREAVMRPLHRHDARRCRQRAEHVPDAEARAVVFDGKLPEHTQSATKRTMGALINAALHDALLQYPQAIVFGEDVAKKGGVYNLTSGLMERFGKARVFDTLLDETTILAVAQGIGQLGMLAIPEIQYLAYVHNAIDQLRGEACSTAFFSAGQFQNPMVVRIASFAYQRGFGGHFHNDNAIGALRDIPGLVLAAPSRGDDAARMLRGLLAMAVEDGRVSCLLEPIALYHMRDLHRPGDGRWLCDYPPPGSALLPGEVGVYGGEARDLLVVTYANGVRMSLRAAAALAETGVRARVVDLRWLNPLPFAAIEQHAAECDHVLVVDECRATGGGIADAVIAHLAEHGHDGPLASVRAADSYVPLGPAAEHVLVQEADVLAAARRLLAHRLPAP